MVEIAATVLIVLWVLGLVTGFSFGGAIHALLALAIVLILVHRHARSRHKAMSQVSPAGILAIVTSRSRADPPE